jgi:hypothetical protein
MGLALIVNVVWNLWQYTRLKRLDSKAELDKIRAGVDELERDVRDLKTKMGLFWRLVEDHMTSLLPKANPIHLTPEEQAASAIYDVYKRNTPTRTLKVLEAALRRELGKSYLEIGEKHVFVMILGAIQSQLYDRGEWAPPRG